MPYRAIELGDAQQHCPPGASGIVNWESGNDDVIQYVEFVQREWKDNDPVLKQAMGSEGQKVQRKTQYSIFGSDGQMLAARYPRDMNETWQTNVIVEEAPANIDSQDDGEKVELVQIVQRLGFVLTRDGLSMFEEIKIAMPGFNRACNKVYKRRGRGRDNSAIHRPSFIHDGGAEDRSSTALINSGLLRQAQLNSLPRGELVRPTNPRWSKKLFNFTAFCGHVVLKAAENKQKRGTCTQRVHYVCLGWGQSFRRGLDTQQDK
ncbi:hypothetical protein C8R43DRAFT_942667 [Mycena crocata]|nr:hypothetical protein C8R43DRAFT_942667 [Mycena crocata]